jgi:hypothetical protein
MRVIRKRLPEGVKQVYETTIGRKVKVVNSLYCKKTTKKEGK